MKRMIILSVMALFLAAAPAFAMEHADSKDKDHEMTFEQRKEAVLTMLDKRISALQEHKICVTNAKTKDDMMTCKKRMDEEREHMKEQKKDHEK